MNFKVFLITENHQSQKALKLSQLSSLLPNEVRPYLECIDIVRSFDGFSLGLNAVGLINNAYMRANPSSVYRYLTHYSIYEKIIKEDLDFCIIIEDEVDLSDLINLLLINPDYPDWAEIINLSTGGIKSLNAYAITGGGAKNLLQLLSDTKWLNGIKRFTLSDYDLPQSLLSEVDALSVEPLQDFSLTNTIIAPIEQLIFAMCEFRKIKSHHDISFINSNSGYKTFYIKNDLKNATYEDFNHNKPSELKENTIDHIFYINLDRDAEKREHADRMLGQLDIPFQRYSAISPEVEDIEYGGKYKEVFSKSKILEARNYFGEKFDHLNIKKYQLGTLGCYLSHYKLLEYIYNNYPSLGCVIILEDDVFLNKETINMVSNLIKEKIDNWDIVRSTWSAPNKLELIKYAHPLSKSYKPWMQREIYKKIRSFYNKYPSVCPIIHTFCGGTHFQVINVNSIPKILSYLDSEILLPIDSLYCTDKLKIYNQKLNVSHDIFSKSSIQLRSND